MAPMKSTDATQQDHLHLAEPADAKLKRQEQRIIETDIATAVAKTKTKRSRARIWKPFSLADSSDDNGSISEPANSRNPTPFDVNAKVFKPSQPDSCDSFTSRASLSFHISAAPAHLHTLPETIPRRDNGAFQLAVGREPRPLSHLAPRLDIYESRPSDKLQSFATCSTTEDTNKDTSNLSATSEPVRGGVAVLCQNARLRMHSNGGFLLEQWSSKLRQWIALDQCSNNRHYNGGAAVNEGALSDIVRQLLQQDTPHCFSITSDERQAKTIGLPQHQKTIRTHVSASSSESLGGSPKPVRLSTRSSNTFGTHQSDMFTTRAFQSYSELTAYPIFSELVHEAAQSSLSNTSSNLFRGVPLHGVLDGQHNVERRGPLTGGSIGAFQPNITLGDAHTWVSSGLNHAHSKFAMQRGSSYWESLTNIDIAQSRQQSTVDTLERLGISSNVPHSLTSNVMQAGSEAMKHCSCGYNALAPLYSMATANDRKVLQYPQQGISMKSDQNPSKKAVPTYTREMGTRLGPLDRGSRKMQTQVPDRLGCAAPETTRADIYSCAYWSPTDCNIKVPSTIVQSPALPYSVPTPQCWQGPFFTENSERRMHIKSYEEELQAWFHDFSKRNRHTEFFKRIKIAHRTYLHRKSPRLTGSPSDIHPPKQYSQNFNEGMTRLLIPVMENLASYVEGPVEKRYGPFARFSSPPDWCIDKSPSGNKSFYGEDWGQPPQCIGRDVRHTSMPHEDCLGGSGTQQP